MAMPDLRVRALDEGLSAGFAVTPSDTVDFRSMTRKIYVGGAGNVAVVWEDGSVVTLVTIAVGVLHDLRIRRINATNTTATNIVGMY